MKKNHLYIVLSIIILFFTCCWYAYIRINDTTEELLEITDNTILEVFCDNTLCDHNFTTAHRATRDGKYYIEPRGRIIAVKVVKNPTEGEISTLYDILSDHYEDHNIVTRVYVVGNTVIIDCR